MQKRIHMICNAHLDPVWQWTWEEGASETLSTFRVAARLCRQFDGFIFNHNEALLYRWIEEFEPELFEEIRSLVRAGKWHIMGGWHLQPDCNMPSGEGFVRQILSGRQYFKEKFGKEPTTAINFDPFGHTRGLVQILAKSGFDSYLFGRPGQNDTPLPAELFTWVGYDGSRVTAYRRWSYNSPLGNATRKIKDVTEACPDGETAICLWGVGNHGGGPSEKDLRDIEELQKVMRAQGVELIHSTPEDFFREVRGKALPEYAGDLNAWAVGCYTSMARIKRQYRRTENDYFTTEQMAAIAHAQGLMEYPKEELRDAMYDLLTVQFHDILPGSSIQPAEDAALQMLSHGAEILSRVRTRAFFALSGGQKPPAPTAIPILIYNPFPYPVEGDFACEMMLWDQNWADEFSMPQVMRDGEALPTQCEKENSNLNLDWRKRPVFHTVLQPMQMNRFDCAFTKIAERPVPETREDETYLYLENDRVRVRIDRSTGYPDSYAVDGRELLSAPCALHVVQDDSDPWGMCVHAFPDRIGTFRLLTDEETAEWFGISRPLAGVHCIESGDVRTTVEAALGYGRSRALVRYTLSKTDVALHVDVRVQWGETQKMLKYAVPSAIADAEAFGEVAYGEERFSQDGLEHCAQKYVRLENADAALSVLTDSTYGFSAEGGTLYMTLLRSAAYCAHPIGDRERIPQNRFTPHMEQGERVFAFELFGGGTDTVRTETPRRALRLNAVIPALSFYPPQSGQKDAPVFTLTGDEILQTTFKQAEDGDGCILRLFNPFDRPARTELRSDVLGICETLTLTPFEIRTLRLQNGRCTETDLTEKGV